jgi:hypothetical protein
VITTATGKTPVRSAAGVNATRPNATATPPAARASAAATRGARSVRRTSWRASRGIRSTSQAKQAAVSPAAMPSAITNGSRSRWVTAGIQIRISATSVNT